MAKSLDPQTKRALADRVAYYRELGIHDFYRREGAAVADSTSEVGAPPFPDFGKGGTSDIVRDPLAVLQSIREDLGDCTRCKLHKQGRKQIVFGVGNPHAELMFIGEGPGADEDEQGEPFVGRAGQLLNNMINAMGVKREQVYIANIVKCRPPGNRVPEPSEAGACEAFLRRQIALMRPRLLIALGKTAASNLLNTDASIGSLRGRLHDCAGLPLIVTYHPAYLLRNLVDKSKAWEDLCFARETMDRLKAQGSAQT
jgi:uracil-DNA glycosylase